MDEDQVDDIQDQDDPTDLRNRRVLPPTGDYRDAQTVLRTEPRLPPPPVPFGQADNARLVRLQQGRQNLVDEIEGGSLKPEDAQPALDRIDGMTRSLLSRQQATASAAEQTQYQQLMKQSAHAHMIEQANQQHAAQNLPAVTRRIPTENGDIIVVPDGKGGWQQLDKPDRPEPPDVENAPLAQPDAPPPPQLSQQAKAAGGVIAPDGTTMFPPPPNAPQAVWDRYNAARDAQVAGERKAQGFSPSIGETAPIADSNISGVTFNQDTGKFEGTPDVTVRNGPYTEQWQGGRMVSTDRPAPPSEGEQPQFFQQAKQAFGREPQQWVPGPGGHPHLNPAWVNYTKEVSIHARELQKQDFQHKQAIEQEERKTRLADAAEQRKLRQSEPQPLANPDSADMATLAKHAIGSNSHKQLADMLKEEEDDLSKSDDIVPTGTTINGNTYNPEGASNPGPWRNVNRTDRHVEAARRVRERLKTMLPSQSTPAAPAQQTQPPAQPAAQPAAQQPRNNSATIKSSETLSALKAVEEGVAAKKERKAAKVPPEFDAQGHQVGPSFDTGFGGAF